MTKKVLFIGGSLNQTTMMHQVSTHLFSYDCFFSPFFADGLLGVLSQKQLLDFTILGGKHRRNTEIYLHEHNLPVDENGTQNKYDLVVSGTDLVVQKIVRNTRFLLIQEGMMEIETWRYGLVKSLGLPRFLANTAATGLSDAYDLFCVASYGYRDEFIRKGVKSNKIVVTGIPNFDNVSEHYKNDFPYRNYVLVATSPLRETFRWDDRNAFIRKVDRIAGKRGVIFKLHPLENVERARKEILSVMPRALVLADGKTEHMVANCEILITQTSSVTFLGLALGKEVHTDLNLPKLMELSPIQNNGSSARRIASLCHRLLQVPLSELKSNRQTGRLRQDWLGLEIQ